MFLSYINGASNLLIFSTILQTFAPQIQNNPTVTNHHQVFFLRALVEILDKVTELSESNNVSAEKVPGPTI